MPTVNERTANPIELLRQDHALLSELLSRMAQTTARVAQKRAELRQSLAPEVFPRVRLAEQALHSP